MSAKLPDPRRVAREREGRWAEHVAAVFMLLQGYRIVGRRHRTPYGELDLIARRGQRMAFIEVKYRRTRDEGEAALTPQQIRRMHKAAGHWIAQRPAFADHEQGFDAIIVLPWSRPILLRDACKPVGYERD